jgi:hybrid cluster-associated redox disulfide protein
MWWDEGIEFEKSFFVGTQTSCRKNTLLFADTQRSVSLVSLHYARLEFDMPINAPGKPKLSRDMTIDHVMANWPEVIPVLLRNKMHCVGCMLTHFHDVSDAAFEHDLDEDKLYQELIAVIS